MIDCGQFEISEILPGRPFPPENMRHSAYVKVFDNVVSTPDEMRGAPKKIRNPFPGMPTKSIGELQHTQGGVIISMCLLN